MSIVANWSYPTAVKLGRGRIKELADACKTLGIKKPLLVTDRGLASMAITGHALDVLEQAGLGRAIFAEVDPNMIVADKLLAATVAMAAVSAVYSYAIWSRISTMSDR